MERSLRRDLDELEVMRKAGWFYHPEEIRNIWDRALISLDLDLVVAQTPERVFEIVSTCNDQLQIARMNHRALGEYTNKFHDKMTRAHALAIEQLYTHGGPQTGIGVRYMYSMKHPTLLRDRVEFIYTFPGEERSFRTNSPMANLQRELGDRTYLLHMVVPGIPRGRQSP